MARCDVNPHATLSGSFSFREWGCTAALKRVKSFVPHGALLARHAPHEPKPFLTVHTHDTTASAAHRGVRRDSGLSPLSRETPSLAGHALPGLLCDVMWVSDLECHRRMGTALWHGDGPGPGLCPRHPLCRHAPYDLSVGGPRHGGKAPRRLGGTGGRESSPCSNGNGSGAGWHNATGLAQAGGPGRSPITGSIIAYQHP